LVEIGLVVLEKKSFKGKVDAGRTTDDRRTDNGPAPWHKLTWPGLWPGELKIDVDE